MSLIFNGFFLFLIIYFGIKNIKKCALIYGICLFIAPVLRLKGIELNFDVWCFPFFLLFYLIRNNVVIIKLKFNTLIPYFIAYIFITLTSMLFTNSMFSIASLYATIRFIATISMFHKVWKGEVIYYIDKVLGIVLFINVFSVILQLTNTIPVQIFYNLYYKSNLTPLMSALEMGYFNRAYGTFGSPVILGGVSAIAYAVYFSAFIDNKYNIKYVVFKLAACALCGIMALSKTAILAIPIITIFNYVFYFLSNKKILKKDLIRNIALILIALIGLTFVVIWMKNRGFFIEWYLKYLKNPFEALATRFDSDTGFLKQTIEIIKRNFVFGVGDYIVEGVFVGDSTYVVLLYHTGIIGLLLYFYPYFIFFLNSFLRRNLMKVAITITFLLISVGLNMHLACWFVPFATIMLEPQNNKKMINISLKL